MEDEIITLQEQLKAALPPSQVQAPPTPPGVEELETKVRQLEASLREETEKRETIEAEQEDLLVLLAENDTKIKTYRGLLIEKGVELQEEESSSEEEDSEGEEEVD